MPSGDTLYSFNLSCELVRSFLSIWRRELPCYSALGAVCKVDTNLGSGQVPDTSAEDYTEK